MGTKQMLVCNVMHLVLDVCEITWVQNDVNKDFGIELVLDVCEITWVQNFTAISLTASTVLDVCEIALIQKATITGSKNSHTKDKTVYRSYKN